VQTNYVRDPDTPGSDSLHSTSHERFAHSATFWIHAARVTRPLQIEWVVGTTRLVGGAGALTVQGSSIAFTITQQGTELKLDVALGGGLDAIPLTLAVTDANGLFVTDTRVLSVAGRRDAEYSILPGREKNLQLARESVLAFLQWRISQGEAPSQPDPAKTLAVPSALGATALLQGMLARGGYTGAIEDIQVK
jgi:hypothetical protein